MERDVKQAELPTIEDHFNSHAHVERDDSLTRARLVNGISTHTLTWSVTLSMVSASSGLKISTHTLTWSVTNSPLQKIAVLRISTHTLTWSVTIFEGMHPGLRRISTHTLTWSVTLDVVYIWCLLNVMRTYFFI